MKKKGSIIAIIFFLFLILTVVFVSFSIKWFIFKCKENSTNLQQNKDNNILYFQQFEEFGNMTIFNVTINKIIVEVGENVTVSTVYTFLCNEGYMRGYGRIGIYGHFWFEYKDSLIDGVECYNTSEAILIDPNHFDAGDICEGGVDLRIDEILDPEICVYCGAVSNKSLEITRAKLNYSLIEQYPLTTFSDDLLNISVLVYNEHANRFVFSNNYIKINIINENTTQNFSRYTDSNGFVNFTVNCSLLGSGNYTIQLQNNETMDYEPTTYQFQVEILDEESCINCTLLNSEEVYTNVEYDDSNYTRAIYLIDCVFDANINYNSSFYDGQCTKIGNQHMAIISSPDMAGTYQIQFKAQPIAIGRSILFNKTLQIKKRPIEMTPLFFRDENQAQLLCQINITDKLINHSIDTNNFIDISVRYNESNWKIGSIECNSSGMAFFTWEIPDKILENYVSFNFIFNSTPAYQFSSLIRNLTITYFEYSGPLQEYIKQNITIRAKLYALNGNTLSNQIIQLKINDQTLNLTTNINGEIIYSFIAPTYGTIIGIEFQFQGSNNILSSLFKCNIEIKLDILHQIWNSLGFILTGISIGIVLMIYLKKIFTKRNLGTLDVD